MNTATRWWTAIKLISLWLVFAGLAASVDSVVVMGTKAGLDDQKNVWDGVYSSGQARRGKEQYAAKCASCHLDSLNGSNTASPLVGEAFLSTWDNKTIRNLYSRIRTTMPDDDPGSLSEQDAVDIVAYVLSVNTCPAGDEELEPRIDALQIIKITQSKIKKE